MSGNEATNISYTGNVAVIAQIVKCDRASAHLSPTSAYAAQLSWLTIPGHVRHDVVLTLSGSKVPRRGAAPLSVDLWNSSMVITKSSSPSLFTLSFHRKTAYDAYITKVWDRGSHYKSNGR
ncbi:hypothetical protein CABS01_14344 [Colletotrichum abscissum]|uniref:uncharacterized protein n=1 Tax=Colletotrichum abscissum TaxID=1671311 RepID=UPI0027D640E9|nr:uncharacterized protein CABS01_14344 [Colletotrichum abscissum]KAK1480818.1 hypothetical protein CABS01_14344 [Colletotrichum abscissum]